MQLEKARPSATGGDAAPPADELMNDSEKVMADLPLSDALRLVVRMRMHLPRQTQEERVEPIIMSNRYIAEPEEPVQPQPETVVEAVTEKEHQQVAQGAYDGTKHSLRKRFAEHQAALAQKVERLRKEYLELHEKWLVHCAKLDEIARANALEEAAATAGRTTRRSAAMGDAVRTDLEMEQILASLGNEELTDANHLSAKNAAVIPDMLSVTKGRVDPLFDDTNNLVEDPHSFYALETGIDDWTDEEKAIFLEKYAMHPKQFGIIAEFLPNKTPAQCVTFYYLHKNTTIDFRKVVAQYNTVGKRTRRGRGGKQKGNALLADILKHDDELSRDSTPNTTSSGRRRRGQATAPPSAATPVTETASEAGPSTASTVDQQKRTNASRRSTTQNTPAGTPTPDPEPTPAPKRPRRRVNPTPKAVAAMGGQDDGEDATVRIALLTRGGDVIDFNTQEDDPRPTKRTRKSRKSKADAEVPPSTSTPAEAPAAPATTAETKFIDQTEATARKKASGSGANWSDEDKALFLQLLRQHGDDFKRIAASMPNKTTIQVTSFYKANLSEMALAKVAAMAPKRSPTPSGPGSANGKASATSTSTGDVPARGRAVVSPRLANGVPASFAPPDTPAPTQPRSSSEEAVRAHLQGATSSPGLPMSPSLAGPSQNPMGNGAPSGSSAPDGRPSSGTSTFSSFPYTNLGPSAFGSAPLEPSAFVRLSTPQANGGGGPTPVMEFSNFAPQPWMSGAHSLVGQGPMVNGAQVPGLPATLETTEDLIRYLEHRTRLTAGQTNDSDFM
ncbi:hypothetical protein C8Q77DRAFT_1219396 [Trametes polyzona]|nr:hypothetical protein C8Q77DRAFT_1219396 [Trametes polyzona]